MCRSQLSPSTTSYGVRTGIGCWAALSALMRISADSSQHWMLANLSSRNAWLHLRHFFPWLTFIHFLNEYYFEKETAKWNFLILLCCFVFLTSYFYFLKDVFNFVFFSWTFHFSLYDVLFVIYTLNFNST